MHKPGQKLSDLPVHSGACGPFVLTGAGGYRQVQTPKGKLFALDTEGNNVLTCGQNGGMIYRVSNPHYLGGYFIKNPYQWGKTAISLKVVFVWSFCESRGRLNDVTV